MAPEIYNHLKKELEAHSDSDRASAMQAYMKGLFEYYGINAPLRKELVKSLKKKYNLKMDQQLWELVHLLWADPHRECQYIALDLITPLAKYLTPDHLPALEKMMITKSWWDTVDGIAPALVGTIFCNFPEQRDTYVYKWMDSEIIWLQRAAIIFQLKYGRNTDWNMLCEAILKNDTSKEFFVRKGQGWALRQYSKYEPSRIMAFIEANPQLSGLTKREALRNITVQ